MPRRPAMLVVLALCLATGLCREARAEQIPVTRAKTLGNAPVVLPGNNGRPLVLVFGFSRAARGEGVAWVKQLLLMQQGGARFDFYQVAMLGRAPGFTHGLIARAIRASVPREYQSRVLLVGEHEDDWRRTLNVTDDGSAYVLLCSSHGDVVWRGKGLRAADVQTLQGAIGGMGGVTAPDGAAAGGAAAAGGMAAAAGVAAPVR